MRCRVRQEAPPGAYADVRGSVAKLRLPLGTCFGLTRRGEMGEIRNGLASASLRKTEGVNDEC